MWFTDFVIGIIIFSLVLISYYTYTTNISKQDSSVMNDLVSDSKTISSILLNEGNPSIWTDETVIRMGLTDNNQIIDQSLLLESSKIDYNKTKKLLGVTNDFFAFFQNKDGKFIAFGGDFGIGDTDVIFNSSLKIAYYWHQDADRLMKDFMEGLGADIYAGKNERAVLVDILDQYDLVLLEDCHCNSPSSDDALQKIEDWVFSGGLALLSEHHHNQFPNTIMGVNTDKGEKGDDGTTNASVIATDPLLALTLNTIIEFEKDVIELVDDPSTEDAIDFTIIAQWDDDTSPSSGTGAIARWGFGQGDVYYFPDYHANYFGEEFVGIVEEAIQNRIYQDGFIQINEEYEELIKIERLAIYNSEIVKMVVYVWQ